MNKFPDLAITSLDTMDLFKMNGDYWFTLDELQNATISNTMEKNDIVGRAGRKISSLKRNKAVTVSGTNGMISGGLLEAQTGGTFEDRAKTQIMYTDYVTIQGNEATLSYAPVGTEGAEINALFIRNADGAANAKLEQAAEAGAGKFVFAPSTKKVTFNTGDYEDGTEIVVFYFRNIAAPVMINNSEAYAQKAEVFINGTAEDKCGKVYHIQFHIAKGDFNGEFDLEMGDDQAVHNFEIESLVGGCGKGGNSVLWELTVFGFDAEDVA